jgi:hypothetical protein
LTLFSLTLHTIFLRANDTPIISAKTIAATEGKFIMEHSKSVDFTDLPLFVKKRSYGNVHFSISKTDEERAISKSVLTTLLKLVC